MSAAQDVAVRSFGAIGTTALIAVTEPGAADGAAAILRQELDALDRACSRFRHDAEIAVLHAAAGARVRVSELLFEVVSMACDVARFTAGAVDPTVGTAIERLGYDRDFAGLPAAARAGLPAATPGPGFEPGPGSGAPRRDPDPAVPAPGWWVVEVDRGARTIAVPEGVHLDVGSSAKGLAADRAARAVAAALGTGVLVSLGGDVAVAGPPPEGGWAVGIAPESSTPGGDVDQVVAIRDGGLASSAPGVRAWQHGGEERHHIVDPRTGRCAPVHLTLVSVAAPTCVEANALSTAALVWGAEAIDRLAGYWRPVRAVRAGGEVLTLNGWPLDALQQDAPGALEPGGVVR